MLQRLGSAVCTARLRASGLVVPRRRVSTVNILKTPPLVTYRVFDTPKATLPATLKLVSSASGLEGPSPCRIFSLLFNGTQVIHLLVSRCMNPFEALLIRPLSDPAVPVKQTPSVVVSSQAHLETTLEEVPSILEYKLESIVRKRKRKMNKHKRRKRMKAQRFRLIREGRK
jgi:predicted phosphoribosyltransferase